MIRFGTLGTANITPRALINPCIDEPRARVYAIAARDFDRASAFAHHHHIPKVLRDYTELVNYDRIDAVYNPLHITAHHEWTLKALHAGKHVLCEKSFASNAAEAEDMAKCADETGLVLMDAYHYRYHPIFIRAREIYLSGVLGEIRHVDAAFHIAVTDPTSIRMNYALGGGVTMDIGCYPISWVRHITGLEPDEVLAEAEVGPPDVDVMLKTTMQLPGGITATTSGDMRADVQFKAYLQVQGSAGTMYVHNPLTPQMGNRIDLTLNGETQTESFSRRSTFAYQLDAFCDAVEDGTELLTHAWDGVAQMRVIDRAYTAAGLPVRGLSRA
jgi:predicted dehydrogenase